MKREKNRKFTIRSQELKPYIFLLLLSLLAYWPLTFGVFSVKNDAIHYFLPNRFHISEALRNGELPLWSPYLYSGFPIHGDMQSGAWNPIVWLFSCFDRYNLTSFHIENLLYIFLSGAGMFQLSYRYSSHHATSFLIASSFMLGGFMLGGQLINWLAAGAYIPFVLAFYLRMLDGSKIAAVLTGMFLYLLVTSAYPSFSILTAYLMLGILLIKMNFKRLKPVIFNHLLLLVVFFGLALPALISFYDLLPYYQRVNGIEYSEAKWNSFEVQHLRTLLLPSASKFQELATNTDLTCRNIYIGIYALPIIVSFPLRFGLRQIALTLMIIFSFLFSLGTSFHRFTYDTLPLFDTFRHPSQARLFIILGLLLLATPMLKKIISGDISTRQMNRLKVSSIFLFITLLALTLIGLTTSSQSKIELPDSRGSIKNILDNVNLATVYFFNGIIQLFFISLFIIWIFNKNRKLTHINLLWILNLFVFCQFLLPVSFVTQTSPFFINHIINKSPTGFPLPNISNTLIENSRNKITSPEFMGTGDFYSKSFQISKNPYNPSLLTQQSLLLNNPTLFNLVASKPVVYLADSIINSVHSSLRKEKGGCSIAYIEKFSKLKNACQESGQIDIKKLTSNSFEIKTNTTDETILILTQNFHSNWSAKVNGNPTTILKANESFMGVLLPPGNSLVIFEFKSPGVAIAVWIQLATLLTIILVITYKHIKRAQK